MAGSFSVFWAKAAATDLSSIIEHIGSEQPLTAKKQLSRIKKSASRLGQFPERGRIVPEFKIHGITAYRELVIEPWRLIYKISDKTVYVNALIDGRRNIEDLLLQRLTR